VKIYANVSWGQGLCVIYTVLFLLSLLIIIIIILGRVLLGFVWGKLG